METTKIKLDGKELEVILDLDSNEKEDNLINLSKEIENTDLEDTIDLSEYLENTMELKLDDTSSNR